MLTMRDRDAKITPIVPKMMGIVCESIPIALQFVEVTLGLGMGPEHVSLWAMFAPQAVVVLPIMFVLKTDLALCMDV
jgi:hypothetical protein